MFARSSGKPARIGSVCLALLLTVLLAPPARAADPVREIESLLQRAQSRLRGMQVEQAATHVQEAEAKLAALRRDDPGSAQVATLGAKVKKVADELARKVVERARRDVNPMRSALESALSGGDEERIERARGKLAEALAKHRALLEAAGGDGGRALLAEAEAALEAKATPAGSTGPSEPPGDERPPPDTLQAGDAKAIHDEIQRRFRGARGLATPVLVAEARTIRALIERLRELDPQHARLASFEEKLDAMVADAYAADVRRARGEIDRRIDRIASYLERNDENERPQLQQQRELLAAALTEHRQALEAAGEEGRSLIARTEQALRDADARIGAALAGDAAVHDWIARLGVYNRGGARDISPGIEGAAQYATIKAWRAEAEALWAAWEEAAVPGGGTAELQRAARFLRESMDEADRNLAYAVTSRLEGARERVERIAALFAADQGWRDDASVAPLRFADELLDEALRALEDLAGYVPDHADLAALRAELARLLAENRERRDASKALTFLRPDQYAGEDAAALKAFARTRVRVDHPGAEVLRLTLFTPAWKTETVVEWTDSTHSALRRRTTRTLMFCVAFQDDTGIYRDFGYLNQDRTPDGVWGATYGHLAKYRAPMLKENVEKDEP